ncbi:hypothetical protein [Actinoplanes sp. URMC 104]
MGFSVATSTALDPEVVRRLALGVAAGCSRRVPAVLRYLGS